MRVCLGGTFDVPHKGHFGLLAMAFEVGTEVFIGLTSDAMANKHRDRKVARFATRRRNLLRFLDDHGWEAEVREITDVYGRSVDPEYEAIVVSAETQHRVAEINTERERRGIAPIRAFVAPYAYGEDGLVISATRIRRGDIDAEGHRLRPLRVAVGTANALKRDAVAGALRRTFPNLSLTVRKFDVASGVPEQPVDGQAALGSRTRADQALRAWPTADYAVGVEAGIVRDRHLGTHLDVQYCTVLDARGHATVGHGGGFCYPEEVTDRAVKGQTVSQILGPLAGDRRIGSTTGAIGYLTRGAIDRRELTQHAVLMALVPRVRPQAYQAVS